MFRAQQTTSSDPAAAGSVLERGSDMAFKIEESFEVEAPMQEAWAFLVDPRQVVVCLPGAEVTDVIDESSYEGRVTVKVGPVTARYKGTLRLEEADADAHVVRLAGEGKESGGSGSAKMSMTGTLTAIDAGRTRVEVEADVDVAGKMARFGRGVMEDVSRQLFREFAQNTQQRFARQPTSASSHAADASPSRSSGSSSGEAEPVDPARQATAPAGTSSSGTSSSGGASKSATSGDASSAKSATEGETTAGRDRRAPNGAPPLRLPGLVFRAILSRIKRFFGA